MSLKHKFLAKVSRNWWHLENTPFFFSLSAFSSLCETSCILSCAFIFTVCCLPSLSSCLLLYYHVLHLLSLEQLICNSLKKVVWALKMPSSALTACHSLKNWARSGLKKLFCVLDSQCLFAVNLEEGFPIQNTNY